MAPQPHPRRPHTRPPSRAGKVCVLRYVWRQCCCDRDAVEYLQCLLSLKLRAYHVGAWTSDRCARFLQGPLLRTTRQSLRKSLRRRFNMSDRNMLVVESPNIRTMPPCCSWPLLRPSAALQARGPADTEWPSGMAAMTGPRISLPHLISREFGSQSCSPMASMPAASAAAPEAQPLLSSVNTTAPAATARAAERVFQIHQILRFMLSKAHHRASTHKCGCRSGDAAIRTCPIHPTTQPTNAWTPPLSSVSRAPDMLTRLWVLFRCGGCSYAVLRGSRQGQCSARLHPQTHREQQ